jgi:hypothetical protein
VLARVPFEYVVPRRLSVNTLVALPVARTADGVFVGVEHRDLPAVQHFTGSSSLAAPPAWRLPPTVAHRWELGPLVAEAVAREFDLAAAADSPLRFVHVDELAANLGAIESANLLIAANRLIHALGR